MKKRKTVLVTCCVICLLAFAAVALAQVLKSVQVKEAQLRSAPSFLGRIVKTAGYTEQVEVLEEKGAWSRVNVVKTGEEGWVHTSALTKKEIIRNPGKDDVERAASSDEIALAGKGFGPEVEAKFKEGNTRVDYGTVDKMEKRVISYKRMLKFLKAGGLLPEGGSK